MANGLCSVCSVNYAVSMHHLVPRARNGSNGSKNLIPICRPCHIFIHKAFSHRELARHYNSLHQLRRNELVNQFVQYVSSRYVGKRVKGKRIVIDDYGMVSIKGVGRL